MAKQDLFGMGPDDDDEDAITPYVILQVIPAEGWRAVFEDTTVKSGGAVRTLGLAGFALIEFVPQGPDQLPARSMRPMVADEHGQIDDVEAFDDFICIVPPGTELKPYVEYVIRVRDSEK